MTYYIYCRRVKRKAENMKKEKQTKGETRSLQIIAIARSVLIKFGYDRFVLRDIAKSANMTLGNLQYYFQTREDLIHAVGRAEIHRNLGTIKNSKNKTNNAEDDLRCLVQNIVNDWQSAGGKIYAVIALLAMHQSRFARLHVEIYTQFYSALSGVLAQQQPDTPRAILMQKTRVITSLLDGALFQIPITTDGSVNVANKDFLNELTEAAIKLT